MKFRPTFFLLFAFLSIGMLTACTPRSSSWHGLSADQELAYLSGGSQLFAVRISDGTEAWHFPEKASGATIFYATPALTEDGQLLVGSAGTDHSFYWLDAKTGEQKAVFDGAKTTWMAAPLVVGDKVYAPNGDGVLYLLDMQGNKIEEFDSGSALWSQPVTDGKHLFIGALDHFLYALDLKTLDVVWKVDMGGALLGSPLLSQEGVLYVGSFNSEITALEAATGKVLWEAPTEGAVWGGPVLASERVYAADLTGRLYAFEPATGSRVWDPPQPDGPITGSPLVFKNDLIVTTEEGSVVLIGPDGKFKNLSSFETGKFYTPAAAAGDLILVAPLEGDYQLIALDVDGKQVWAFPPKEK